MGGQLWKALLLGWTSSTLLLILVLQNAVEHSSACNEAICASVVSKCLLTGSCKCDLVTCSCCKDCFSCLNYLYDECCSCVDLCPKPNVTANPLSKKSHVEEFSEPIPGLFQALTTEPDPLERWMAFSFPVDFDMAPYIPKREKEVDYHMQTVEEDIQPVKSTVMTLNCSVAYMAQCSSWHKCSALCQSMGATSYRWFHDGCCECIGNTCINYGINESRCSQCPPPKDSLNNQYDDYGQEDEDVDSGEED